MSMTTERSHNGHNADTVLIVEDDAATWRLYKFLLSNGGYVVLPKTAWQQSKCSSVIVATW